MKSLLVAVVLAIPLVTSQVAYADYITNGGFETGFFGWTVASSFTSVESAGYGGHSPHSGTFFAALGNIGCCGTLSQTFADVPGQALTIQYWLASDGFTPNYFEAQFNGVTLSGSAQTNIPDSRPNYTLYTFQVTATGSDTLTLFNRNDPAYLALDDVSVNASVPVPATLGLLAVGLALVGLRRRAW